MTFPLQFCGGKTMIKRSLNLVVGLIFLLSPQFASANGIPFTPSRNQSPLRIYFINVGQGDAEFIQLPSGKTVLIDGGPRADSVSSFLQTHGIKEISYLVLTHPHADHYRGLGWVFDHLAVDNFYDTKMNNSLASTVNSTVKQGASLWGADGVRQKARAEKGCQTTYPRIGDVLGWDDE